VKREFKDRVKSSFPSYWSEEGSYLLGMINNEVGWEEQENRLLNIDFVIRRRLDRQHSVTDRFANVLFMLLAGATLHCSIVHRCRHKAHLHDAQSRAGINDGDKEIRNEREKEN
jgi:hypothetical protein